MPTIVEIDVNGNRVEREFNEDELRDWRQHKSQVEASGMASNMSQARALRDTIFNRLNGIQLDNLANQVVVDAIAAAKQSLKDLPQSNAVTGAKDPAELKLAITTSYKTIAAKLLTDAPAAVTAFNGLEL